jgi:enamine deaminase RidA (YjgF/YER057c/UK114 family)
VQHFSPSCLPPAIGYSQIGIVGPGTLAFISGQVGVDENWILAPDFEGQVRRAMANLLAAVNSCGSGLESVVKINVFLKQGTDAKVFEKVRDEYFKSIEPMPASTLLFVSGLYEPDALIEVEAVLGILSDAFTDDL